MVETSELDPRVHCERDPATHIARITIDNPDRRNAYDPPMRRAMRQHLDELAIDDALARLADPLVTELTAGHPERIRVCASETCEWIFYDASPTARCRWCDMSTCGNRAKAARHRARARGDGPAAAAPPSA